MAKTFRQRVHEARRHVRMLSPQEAKALMDHDKVMVVDVGEAWQIAERGTIPGARNITRGEIDVVADLEEPRRDPALQDRAQTLLLTCGGGGKATLAASALMEMGFTQVAAIKGGCRAWREAGFPLVKPRAQGSA